MMIQGIIFGLLAAMAQSLCYLFSRRFVMRPGNTSTVLFGLAHVCMGVFALALLPFCYASSVYAVGAYGWPMAGAVFFYMVGQVCLFQAVKITDASRVAPLLGLKILILSLIAVLFTLETVTPWQWVAVVLSVAAALALNYSGAGIPWRGIAAILGACLGYCLSDLSIVLLTKRLAPDGALRGILLATCLSYILSAWVGVALVFGGSRENRAPQKWKEALPVAITWFAAMICLFVCFRLLGAVFGNIVQSTRGPLSVLLGAAIAHVGHEHLEARVGGWTLLRRVAAAVVMCLAIALFAAERAKAPPPPPAPTVAGPAES